MHLHSLAKRWPVRTNDGYGVAVLRGGIQAVRRQTKLEHGLRRSQTLHPGVLIVMLRFRADLGLYVHLHALLTDGGFEAVR